MNNVFWRVFAYRHSRRADALRLAPNACPTSASLADNSAALAILKMWLLSRSPSPEEIIATVTTASLELTTVMQTMQTALQAGFCTHMTHANAHDTTAIIDKHLRELKLILIGVCFAAMLRLSDEMP